MHPVGGTSFLLDQFVQFPAVLVGRIKQDTGITDHLLWASAADVYGTTRQMIGAFRPATEPIHLLAPIPTRDDHGDLLRHTGTVASVSRERSDRITGGLSLACRIAIKAIVPLPEQFQPQAQPCQILYRHMAWDVPIQCIITRFR